MSRPREFCHESTPTRIRLSRAPIVGRVARHRQRPVMMRSSRCTSHRTFAPRHTHHSTSLARRATLLTITKRANGGRLIGNRTRDRIRTQQSTRRCLLRCLARPPRDHVR